MCLVLLSFHSIPSQPVVLAANRDEFYDRGSAPPQLLANSPRVFGGKDLRHGGTWLGMNEFGVIAGITNRHCGEAPRENLPSRGRLCLEALARPSSREAAQWVVETRAKRAYNPFIFFAVDIDEAWYVTDAPGQDAKQLRPGWYLIDNCCLNNPDSPRVRRARELLDRATLRLSSDFPSMLAAILRDHGEGHDGANLDAVCRHGRTAGTRSSSILVIEFANRMRYWHAEGPPCENDFEEMLLPWRKP